MLCGLRRFGRRPMLLVSGFGVFVSVIMLGTTFLFEDISEAAALVGLCGFMSAFSFGYGVPTLTHKE